MVQPALQPGWKQNWVRRLVIYDTCTQNMFACDERVVMVKNDCALSAAYYQHSLHATEFWMQVHSVLFLTSHFIVVLVLHWLLVSTASVTLYACRLPSSMRQKLIYFPNIVHLKQKRRLYVCVCVDVWMFEWKCMQRQRGRLLKSLDLSHISTNKAVETGKQNSEGDWTHSSGPIRCVTAWH